MYELKFMQHLPMDRSGGGNNMLSILSDLVRRAGALARGGYATMEVKGNASNVVTDRDVAVQQFLVENLEQIFPGIGFICEENAGQRDTDAHRVTAVNQAPAGWRIIANTHCQCPYCGVKLTKQADQDEENPDAIQLDEEDGKKLQKFRIAADFVSRLIAPSTLELMTKASPKDPQKVSLHSGQQFISFVDSRQMAARSTIKQNLEEERQWVYGTIFHELCRLANASAMTKEEAVRHYEAIYDSTNRKDPRHKDAEVKLDILEGEDLLAIEKLLIEMRPKQCLSWLDILDLLLNDKYVNVFCQQFAERSELSLELDDNGDIKPETKRRYILAIMVEYLSKRPYSLACSFFAASYSEFSERSP